MFKYMFTAIGMFTKLPIKKGWETENGAGALCFFPLCGVLCGIVNATVIFLCRYFSIPNNLTAFFMLIAMFLMCGFLHFDGFMDVADAMLSARDKEGKVKILKDSNVGAFSVISAGIVLLGFYSAFCVVAEKISIVFLFLVPAASRAFCAIMLFEMKPLSQTGILAFFRSGKKKYYSYIMAAIFVSICAVVFFFSLVYPTALVFALAASLILSLSAQKGLGGINGDVIGACVITFELVAYMAAAILF